MGRANILRRSATAQADSRPERGPTRIFGSLVDRSLLDLTARILTEVLAPWVIVIAIPFAVTWQSTHRAVTTVGWGVVVALTSSVIAMAVIVWGARHGRWDGHHVRNREDRAVPFVVLIACTAAGGTALILAHAPAPVTALDISMIVSLLVTGAVTTRWKISIHAAVAAGAAGAAAITYGPAFVLLAVPAAGVAWSRVRLGDHTTAQVITGLATGALIGSGLYGLLR